MDAAKAVLFDLDNTLVDSDLAFATWATWFARERLGLANEQEIAAEVDLIVRPDANGSAPRATRLAELRERHSLPERPDVFMAAFRAQLLAVLPPLDDGARRLLAVLDDARIPWGIVTNGSRSQVLKIRKLGLENRAACVVVSDAVGFRKPDPAIFRLAAERLGIALGTALFIGDDPDADIVGAARVGMRTAWLRRGREWPARLASAPPDYPIDSLADLHLVLGIRREKRF